MPVHFKTYCHDEYEEYGFKIYGRPPYEEPLPICHRGFSPQGYLYIEFAGTMRVLQMDCEMRSILMESIFDLPDIRSDSDLEPLEDALFLSNWGSGEENSPSSFILNLHPWKRELELIFEADCYPAYYHADGNVEYYYDEHFHLGYIKVINLTEKEYNFLKRFA